MPSKKISELIPTNALQDGNNFVIEQDGITKRIGYFFLKGDLSLRITGDVAYLPSPASNFSNRNEIVKSTIDGNYYMIDYNGVSLNILDLVENLFTNGVRLDGGKAKLGGSLSENTSIDLNNKNLNFIGVGNVNIGGAGGTEKLTIHDGAIELKDGALIVKSKDSAKRFKMTVDDYGIWDSEEIL